MKVKTSNKSGNKNFSIFMNTKGKNVVLTSKVSDAENLFLELKEKKLDTYLVFMPHTETLPYDFFSPSKETKNKRIQAISDIQSKRKFLLICSIQAFMNPCSGLGHILPINSFKVGQDFNREEFIKDIINSGYERTEVVGGTGSYSLRGSIIDIYPSSSNFPIRIELLNEKIESLRTFNPNSQLTIERIDSFSTLPANEYPINDEGIKLFKKNWRQKFDVHEDDSEIFTAVSKGKRHEGIEIYLPLFFNAKTCLHDYLSNVDQFFLDEGILDEIDIYENLIKERYEEYRYDVTRPLIKPEELYLTKTEFLDNTKKKKIKTFSLEKTPIITKDKAHKAEDINNRGLPTQTPIIGDLVVHLFHGIGIYKGLKNITSRNITTECLEIEYRDTSKVFVPIDSMHLVSKYFGPEDINLDVLGSQKWIKKKNLALKKTFDTAAELLKIEAKRNLKFIEEFQIPRKEYSEFVDKFSFTETPDQIKTIKNIEIDLMSSKPMDRIVCGEVGFGKTEVAMRASFITAFNNQQVCLLVPTTVLAQQHYESFKQRFISTAINIKKISRDVNKSQKNETLKELKEGKIDIIIGTHSLLQKNIDFKNLGLLIIDEEHRFGVRQKEKIKTLKENLNILYLTATPIPRSLNFALSELKDLSIIATAPEDRLSVKTFIYRFNRNLIKESIQREVLRSGQIYYLCNDLRLIDNRKEILQEQFPDLNIEVVHGRLKGAEIQERMLRFQEGVIDILVCSTIIESGLDISNANTLIVEEADRLGLAQLHQLRGRVGRGSKQAYAYFLKSTRIINRKKSEARLEALKSTDSLSAGFLLSLKDMEIRGAGEILGENQSGVMESIGIDLYLKLLKKATKQIKEGKIENIEIEKITIINLNTSSYIPSNYLPDINQRLIMYSRISAINSLNELKDIQMEMINRFGLFPRELTSLFLMTEINLLALKNGINEISIVKDNIEINYSSSIKNKRINLKTNFEENAKNILNTIS
tara:strand:- start:6643 stop:9597 length:2955 start_codon:yes stop_codon:yes gene_type:complete